jgi:GTPase SAR1 family protein
VFGVQNAGKSSFLEALLGFRFNLVESGKALHIYNKGSYYFLFRTRYKKTTIDTDD